MAKRVTPLPVVDSVKQPGMHRVTFLVDEEGNIMQVNVRAEIDDPALTVTDKGRLNEITEDQHLTAQEKAGLKAYFQGRVTAKTGITFT